MTAGHPVTALVDTDSLRIDAYFEETRLPRIPVRIALDDGPADVRVIPGRTATVEVAEANR